MFEDLTTVQFLIALIGAIGFAMVYVALFGWNFSTKRTNVN